MRITRTIPEYICIHGAAYIRTDIAAERMHQSWLHGVLRTFITVTHPSPPTDPTHAPDAHDLPIFTGLDVGDLRP